MKTTLLLLILFLTAVALEAQVRFPAPPTSDADGGLTTNTNGIEFHLNGADVNKVLAAYSELVGRTLLRGTVQGSIILNTQSPLTKQEAVEALQAVFALNGIEVVNVGDKFVKVVTPDQAGGSGQIPIVDDPSKIQDLGGYVTYIARLKYVKPSVMMQIITPFSKLPNAIMPIDDNYTMVIRDHAENVKRMVEMINQVDVGGSQTEIISEVIPIKYLHASEIADALNSLGGASGGTVNIGNDSSTPSGSTGARPIGGAVNSPGTIGQPRPIGTTATPNGTPAGGTTVQQRLLSIINRASGSGGQQDQIQLFGQTKIVANERSNSLLVFATRQDMNAITNVIAKLDVLPPQVQIESAIIDVNLNKAQNIGVSAAQNPKTYSSRAGGIAGGGGSVNGSTFFDFLSGNGSFTSGTNSSAVFGNVLPSGLSYFGNIGPTWDVALQAAANDSSASVIQRPRIQTSQAKDATFKVGQTVPYVTSTTYGSAYGNGTSYQQLFVGIELTVTPFINPEGLVVMHISQEIDDLNGTTHIDNVGDVPNTTTRSLESDIAVKDRDTIMLGGFIRSDHTKSKAGVPYLQDIPLLGTLFSQRSSKNDRTETIVLIRPTVLRSPEEASQQAISEQNRLPGVKAALHDDTINEHKLIETEQKNEAAEDKALKKTSVNSGGTYDGDGFFMPVPPASAPLNP